MRQLRAGHCSLSEDWRDFAGSRHTHLMGEARRKALAARRGAGDGPAEPQVVDTLGGRMHVRWDEGAAATPHGQLVFFAEFLAATGVFERWVSSCPLEYRSGNAPDKRDVLGTLMLGLLAGHRRYAHITALRGDAVAAQALGMAKVISEDALRQSFENAGRRAVHGLEPYLTMLGTIAAAAPLLGLLGTVIGMIEIFGSQAPTGQSPTG